MNLFSKDKELILKITNGILLIWFLGALMFTGYNIIEKLVKEPGYTYNEYKLQYCGKYDEITDYESNCQEMYDRSKLDNKHSDFYTTRSLYTSILNVVIVGGALFLLNKKKETKK